MTTELNSVDSDMCDSRTAGGKPTSQPCGITETSCNQSYKTKTILKWLRIQIYKTTQLASMGSVRKLTEQMAPYCGQ